MDVEQVITELYGLRPVDFTAARNASVAQARREKDAAAARRIAALRKPTLAVWAAGLFARARPDDAAALLRLGAQLRTAHRELDGTRLRALSHEQHRVIAALARETVQIAGETGERISESVLREIEQIFHALLADEDAGRQWLAGRLTSTPKAPVGFEGVEPAPGATPPSPAPPAPRPAKSSSVPPPEAARDVAAERRAREHERRLEAARRTAAEAQTAHERARTEVSRAAMALERAQAEAAAAREELRAVQLRLEAAEEAAGRARSRHHEAEAAARKAEQAATSAARRLREAEAAPE
ncbi:hypothetical protein PL81_15330 [Streptomyces sp. RSD-27]|nr:hypothetical protein PL81_15330 [Streptomyces sp. RSD-27]